MSENNFAKALLSPDGAPESFDFYSVFGGSPGARPYKTVDSNTPGNDTDAERREWKFSFHHDVFVIHRPWEECGRCYKVFRAQEESGAADVDGDIVCPHTRMKQYLELMQKFMKGGYQQISYKQETLKSGVIQVSVSWAVPDSATKEKGEKKAAPRL